MMQRWDIYRAYVKQQDTNKVDHRPILIINVNPSDFICMKITTNLDRKGPFEYHIKDWIGAGLDQPSCVRIKKKIKFKNFDNIVKLGTLQKIDIDAIKDICNTYNIKLTEGVNELGEAMTNKEKLMKRFPELDLNEDAEMNNNKLNKQEVLDWLGEHDLAWEDFINYFEDIYQSSAEVPIDEILGWISDHDDLAEDFENKFGISVNADVCDDDCDWFEDELEEHVAIDVYNQLNSPNILEIKPSKLKESVEGKWDIGSNKLIATDSQEFANLVDLAKLLQERSPNKYQYTVEKTYEDFGAGMQWYNIICHDKKGDSWQVLNPKEWLDLANGDKSVEETYQNIVTDRFFQDTVEKGSIFSILDKFQ